VKQGVVTAEELPTLLQVLARPLPVTFRVNPEHPEGVSLMRRLRKRNLGSMTGVRAGLREWRWRGKRLEFLARELKQLPAGCVAWELGLDLAGLKLGRQKHPELQQLFTAMENVAGAGALVRQEVVSMLPAVLLQARPGERVLDMCAAPGSKTSQLLEVMADAPGGLVAANDANGDRLKTLQRRLSGVEAATRAAGAGPHQCQR